VHLWSASVSDDPDAEPVVNEFSHGKFLFEFILILERAISMTFTSFVINRVRGPAEGRRVYSKVVRRGIEPGGGRGQSTGSTGRLRRPARHHDAAVVAHGPGFARFCHERRCVHLNSFSCEQLD